MCPLANVIRDTLYITFKVYNMFIDAISHIELVEHTPIMPQDYKEVDNESRQLIAALYYPMCQTKKWIPQV